MKRFTAAALAAATAMSLAVAPAQAQDVTLDRETSESLGLMGRMLFDKGAMPDTDGARKMAYGSVEQGSSAEQAYKATQAGWIVTWIAVGIGGVGLLALAAQAAGLIPAGTIQLPF